MNRKSDAVAALIRPFEGRGLDAHYLGFFECFNRQLFFEAHEVLEELWLSQRDGPNGLFYKGLIQLAGAFVHVQKSRPGPALALLRLAQANLEQFPPTHEGIDLRRVLATIERWRHELSSTGPATSVLGSRSDAAVRLQVPDEVVR